MLADLCLRARSPSRGAALAAQNLTAPSRPVSSLCAAQNVGGKGRRASRRSVGSSKGASEDAELGQFRVVVHDRSPQCGCPETVRSSLGEPGAAFPTPDRQRAWASMHVFLTPSVLFASAGRTVDRRRRQQGVLPRGICRRGMSIPLPARRAPLGLPQPRALVCCPFRSQRRGVATLVRSPRALLSSSLRLCASPAVLAAVCFHLKAYSCRLQ